MSIRLMSQVWSLDLDHAEQAVLLAFCDHADDEGTAFPGVGYLAWKTGYSDRQVQQIMASLRERGVLVTLKFAGGGRGRATVYRVDLSQLPRKADYQPASVEQAALRFPKKPQEIKGAKTAPFPETKGAADTERVQPAAPKGAEKPVKGELATAPQPENHQESPLETARDRANEEIWTTARQGIAEKIGQHAFECWIRPLVYAGTRAGSVYLRAPNADVASVAAVKHGREIAAVIAANFPNHGVQITT